MERKKNKKKKEQNGVQRGQYYPSAPGTLTHFAQRSVEICQILYENQKNIKKII